MRSELFIVAFAGFALADADTPANTEITAKPATAQSLSMPAVPESAPPFQTDAEL